ncbi:MAG: hypothetical protein JWP66_892 [Naasia sp.]|nr:hypothetical protein [Naasia sp.]
MARRPAPVRVLLPEAMKAQVTRRLFLGGALGAGASFALAACAPGTTGGGGGGNGLNVYTWGEYDDPAVLKSFTSEFGPSITLDSYGSNQEMIAKISAAAGTSGYDITVPTHQYIAQMAELDLLEELDHSLLPNMKNIQASFLDQDFDPGNVFSVPKAWGSTGFAYDTTVIQRDLESWADFWDAAQKEASGSFSLAEDPNEIAYAFYLANGIDMNTEDEADIEAFRQFVTTAIAPHIQAFESYPSDAVAAGSRTLVHGWNGDLRQGIINNEDQERYRWVTPTEGLPTFIDNWCIVKGSKNVESAHEFINYVLDPEISLRELEYIGYNTAVEGIEEMAADTVRADIIFFNEEETASQQFSLLTTAEEAHVAVYDELRAAAGQ